jgi:hypothetical protein
MQASIRSESDDRVQAVGLRMAFGMASEYAVAALLVRSRCGSSPPTTGLDAFVWDFAMLWFSGRSSLWTMIVVRRNGRERHYLERLKRELADL